MGGVSPPQENLKPHEVTPKVPQSRPELPPSLRPNLQLGIMGTCSQVQKWRKGDHVKG